MLALAPAIGVRLTWLIVLELIGLELLMTVTMTAFGVFVASQIRRMEDPADPGARGAARTPGQGGVSVVGVARWGTGRP